MSLILDALKRAERERHAEPSAALADVPGGRASRRRRWLRAAGLGLLALAAIAVALSVVRRPQRAAEETPPARTALPSPAAAPQGAQPPAVPAGAPDTAEPPVPRAATPAPAPIPARPAPGVIPGTEGLSSLDELTPDSDLELVPAEPAPQAETPSTMPRTQAQAPATEAEPEAPAAPTAAAPRATEESPPAVPPALTQKPPVRRLREMPPDYRADFPALTIEVHVFEPNRRFVMINGRRYREGERLAEGPQILEIVRDGIVFEHRGEKVLFPLGR